MAILKKCSLLSCSRPDETSDLHLAVWFPSDSQPIVLWVHRQCFDASRSSSVLPDAPEDLGHIPAHARCLFCGLALPIVGHHAYALDAGQTSPPTRYWAHAQCLKHEIPGFLPSTSNAA